MHLNCKKWFCRILVSFLLFHSIDSLSGVESQNYRKACAPAQAISAGYSRLIFNENFSKLASRDDGVSYDGDNGVIWGNGLGFSPPSPSNLISWDGPGLLTLSSAAGSAGAINTHLRSWPKGAGSESTVFHYGYFEASMRLIGFVPPDNWASFWLLSALHQEVYSYIDEWSEIDIFESGFFPGYAAALHDWHYIGYTGSVYEKPSQNPSYSIWYRLPKNIDFTQWHTYGALWIPGRVYYYFDNTLIQASETNTINDLQSCSIILSVSGNNKSRAQFRWVHVFK